MTSQYIVQCIMGPINCYIGIWKVMFYLLDFSSVHNDIHSWWGKKFGVFPENSIQNGQQFHSRCWSTCGIFRKFGIFYLWNHSCKASRVSPSEAVIWHSLGLQSVSCTYCKCISRSTLELSSWLEANWASHPGNRVGSTFPALNQCT